MGEEAHGADRLRGQLAEGARSLELSRRGAALAREAADASAKLAATYEKLARQGRHESTNSRLARTHRRNEACQQGAARLHDKYARQLERWLTLRVARVELRPVFVAVVASVAGWQGAVLTLLTDGRAEGLVAASSPSVRGAHELEVALGEGPSWEAVRDQTTAIARGSELERRWPQYGPAVRDLGVESVAAAPILLGGRCGGSITLVNLHSITHSYGVRQLGEGAEALAAVLQTSDSSPVDGHDPLGLKLFEKEDFQPSLHAAAGVLHERRAYTMADAVALIRAHAFAEDRSVAAVADGVIRGTWLP